MAVIRVTDLNLRAVIGTNEWERECRQDVIINIIIEFDAARAAQSDDLNETVDYKAITKKIIAFVENSQFYLLEKLTDQLLNIVMADKKVLAATVRVDKPLALRFSKSVSMEISRTREG